MQAHLRIETAAEAAAAIEELERLEQAFRAGLDPAPSRELAREIIRLRMSLTRYSLRTEMREAYDEQVG